MLYEFIDTYRERIIAKARQKVQVRPWPPASTTELENGVPMFLSQLVETQIAADAKQPGAEVRPVSTVRESIEGTHERLLHEIETRVVVETHAARMTIEHVHVPVHERCVRRLVAVEGTRDELRVGRFRYGRRIESRRAHWTTTTATTPPMPSALRPGTFSGTNHVPSALTNA